MNSAILNNLRQQSDLLVAQSSLGHLRFLHEEIRWDWRCIGIKGPRGVGKTTLLLQRIRLSEAAAKSVYLSLDDFHFNAHSLRDTVEAFRRAGLTHFYLDEVHKYPSWSQELKNLYDFYPDIFIVFTGSSVVELARQEVDLSRRAIMHDLPGLSFREYLKLSGLLDLPAISLADLLEKHRKIALEVASKIRPLEHFQPYLKDGYYPFFLENRPLATIRLRQITKLILELDLVTLEGGRVPQVQKIARLLQLIAESAPFKPNINNLAQAIGIDRDTVGRYFSHLERAQLIALLFAESGNLAGVQRPEKIFLDNPNLCHALAAREPEIGTLRETFFQNQTRVKNRISYTAIGDFLLNSEHIVEVGGRSKTRQQLAAAPAGFLAVDDVEVGDGQRIPLWLFGFLY